MKSIFNYKKSHWEKKKWNNYIIHYKHTASKNSLFVMHSLDDLFIKPSELHGNEKINVMNDKFSDIIYVRWTLYMFSILFHYKAIPFGKSTFKVKLSIDSISREISLISISSPPALCSVFRKWTMSTLVRTVPHCVL